MHRKCLQVIVSNAIEKNEMNTNQFSPGNLFDQMRRLNEKHAHDLEKLVEERREQLAIVREVLEIYRTILSKKDKFGRK